ncbi:MAG: hypothetical protein A3A86_00760 [Elusimicrobia bacterium RIFCSPLOWO2_01_FULL_60_11]|nr:MAG: hypothetical protein A3A86_00760 [Elusimicrobia bacterium RIFCSPLOWO2_01_FULL_60_11]
MSVREFLAPIFRRRWLLLGILPLWIVPFSLLRTLERDGREIFAAQKNALILEVYSRTDLPSDAYPLLEESLRALPDVKEVTAASPEESLKRVADDPALGVDSTWLRKKMADMKGKDTLLPWSYDVYPEKWDESSLSDLTRRIEAIEVGRGKVKAVSEVHYDRERRALTFALFNYVRWIRRSLGILIAVGLYVGAFFAFKVRKYYFEQENWAREAGGFLILAVLGGLLSHGLLLSVLSQAFFPETFNWKVYVGRFLPLELALSVYFCLCAHAALVLERRR